MRSSRSTIRSARMARPGGNQLHPFLIGPPAAPARARDDRRPARHPPGDSREVRRGRRARVRVRGTGRQRVRRFTRNRPTRRDTTGVIAGRVIDAETSGAARGHDDLDRRDDAGHARRRRRPLRDQRRRRRRPDDSRAPARLRDARPRGRRSRRRHDARRAAARAGSAGAERRANRSEARSTASCSIRRPAVGTVQITARAAEGVPKFGDPDVMRIVQLLPGVEARNDFSTGFNVRGGEADQNLILLDGYPIYNPFHVGGLFSTFIDPTVRRHHADDRRLSGALRQPAVERARRALGGRGARRRARHGRAVAACRRRASWAARSTTGRRRG